MPGNRDALPNIMNLHRKVKFLVAPNKVVHNKDW
ncbi:hypothetical protein FHX37_1657 [Haloactinospora alba]|uniref:Uncharacterized protein n=1 Tax=Haloactinospora alba TaxID=405555 RepID=A0A543NIR8_9ACTN|nr:hypothetical protein FHX37_1657 [Haloactinospora alba]